MLHQGQPADSSRTVSAHGYITVKPSLIMARKKFRGSILKRTRCIAEEKGNSMPCRYGPRHDENGQEETQGQKPIIFNIRKLV